jgi:protein-S-isoprenylcysteine O-methyltransferase Ste14
MKMQDKKLLKLSWIAYVIILFEMLYMATPFAVFFYGVYRFPLELLASGKYTAWLVQTVFPHFTWSSSAMVNMILSLSVPAMIAGLVVFITGFIQIYYAKFTKKGAVTGGLYRFIRHPQYTAWTLFGLGMSIFWSRLIIWLMFITMTFIYYFLARAEEKECLEKYPDTYKNYYERTGMFFPVIFKGFEMTRLFPQKVIKRIIMITCIYLVICTAVMLGGMKLRKITIGSFSTAAGENFLSLSLTEMPEKKIMQVTGLILNNAEIQTVIKEKVKGDRNLLIYIIPEAWSISELGVESRDLNPMSNVQTHGNPVETNPGLKKVLISEPVLYTDTNDVRRILEYSVRQRPVLLAKVDMVNNRVIHIVRDGLGSMYGEIPVPLF